MTLFVKKCEGIVVGVRAIKGPSFSRIVQVIKFSVAVALEPELAES